MLPEQSDAHEIACRLPRRRSSVPRARAMLSVMLSGWHVDQETLDTAELLLSELLTNAIRVPVPEDRQVGVRITLSEEDLLRLEVSDAGAGWPMLRRPGEGETGGRGLLLVESLAHRWGVYDRAGGIGKTVWAELKAPKVVVTPVEREVAAVTVQPGQQVRMWGLWHTVHDVRGERSTLGGLAMVLRLDGGAVVRVGAAEPLTVRDGVSSPPRGGRGKGARSDYA